MIDFDELIDLYLERENKPKGIGRYYPSEVGKCLRKIWYSYKYPKEVEPWLLKVFELGNIIHDFIANVIKSQKTSDVELLKEELPVKMDIDDFVISGRVDDLMLVKSNGKHFLVEVKSTKSIDYVKSPQPQHESQLQFYMHASGVRNGILLYVDKRDLKTKTFEIPYSDKKSEDIIERFRFIHKTLTQNELPVAEAKAIPDWKWMCRYCEYKEMCDRNEK
jgi:CRISPR/Cas system-associated exonuclease Cas4 (RecB family)